MLHESVLKLYRRLRLDGYRKLFGAVQEREGSLSAMEAFSADLINLLGDVEKVVSAPDRREIRLRTGKKFAQYFDEDRPVICAAAEKVRTQFSEEEIDAARRVLDALLEAMQDGTSQKS